MNIGPLIRKRRIELGISAKELSNRAGIAESTLYELERGDMKGTTKLASIAQALKLDPAQLQKGKLIPVQELTVAEPRPSYFSNSSDEILLSKAIKLARGFTALVKADISDEEFAIQVSIIFRALKEGIDDEAELISALIRELKKRR